MNVIKAGCFYWMRGERTRLFSHLLAALAVAGGLLGPADLAAQDDSSANKKAQVAKVQVENSAKAAPGDQTAAEAAEVETNAPDATEGQGAHIRIRDGNGVTRDALVVIGRNAELKKGETAEAVVVIGGSAKIDGKVLHGAVVIGGDLEVSGEIGEAAVAVMGNVRAAEGARINGEVVAVGGRAEIAEGVKVHGHTQEVDFGGVTQADWLRKWFSRALLQLRPLAPGVGWLWAGWGILLLVYLLIATAFSKPVDACIDELTRRPATTFVMGLLTQLLLPLVLVILVAIVVGIVVVPFVIAALVLGFLVGKVAILEWLGFKIGRSFGGGLVKPPTALLLGALVITLLYLVPVLGMLTFLVVSVWGLGTVVMAAFAGFRRELPRKPAPSAPPEWVSPVSPAGAVPTAAPGAAFERTQLDNAVPPSEPTSPNPGETIPPLTPHVAAAGAAVANLPDALAFPKASFWERLGAGFLDIVLVSILAGVVGGPPQGFLVALAYFAGMWAWKATTIGGIVLGIKVARVDAQEITFTIALVRALAAAFSAVVLFLGFLWILWDKDRQGWHDRIAGTVVVKLPKGTPLVCI